LKPKIKIDQVSVDAASDSSLTATEGGADDDNAANDQERNLSQLESTDFFDVREVI